MKIDMQGVRCGSAVALRAVGISISRDLKWECLCDCGQLFLATGYELRSGKRKGCSDCAKKRSRQSSVTHGKPKRRSIGFGQKSKLVAITPSDQIICIMVPEVLLCVNDGLNLLRHFCLIWENVPAISTQLSASTLMVIILLKTANGQHCKSRQTISRQLSG